MIKENSESFLMEALLTGDPSKYIERQEKRGQAVLVASSGLPIAGSIDTPENKAALERMGITFPGPSDDLFVKAALPGGWKLVPTDHDMWSSLLDEKGRKRASVFYKAAFYDCRAFMRLDRRFHCDYEPVGGWMSPEKSGRIIHRVMDGSKIIHETARHHRSRP